jgi:transmembrane sensor
VHQGSRSERASIDAEAADWLVRLGGATLDDAERSRFDRWLSSSPRHREAFELAQRAWKSLGDVAAPVPKEKKKRRRLRPALALAASVLVAALAVREYGAAAWLVFGADHRTSVGEVRRVTLPDGSVATLDTASAIAVEYGAGERRVELLKGAARFDVARVLEPARDPFVVHAAGGEVRALGTSFVVTLLEDGAAVQVIEHSVVVSHEAAGGSAQIVHEGQRALYRTGTIVALKSDDRSSAGTWQHGHLLFDRALVRDVLAEINRYRQTRVVAVGDSLKERRISGMFRIDDLDRGIVSIASELGARTAQVPGVITVLY